MYIYISDDWSFNCLLAFGSQTISYCVTKTDWDSSTFSLFFHFYPQQKQQHTHSYLVVEKKIFTWPCSLEVWCTMFKLLVHVWSTNDPQQCNKPSVNQRPIRVVFSVYLVVVANIRISHTVPFLVYSLNLFAMIWLIHFISFSFNTVTQFKHIFWRNGLNLDTTNIHHHHHHHSTGQCCLRRGIFIFFQFKSSS